MAWAEPSEVLRAEGPRRTPVQQSLNYLCIQHTEFQTKWSDRRIMQLRVESFEACPKRWIRHLISDERSTLSWVTPPRYENWFICL